MKNVKSKVLFIILLLLVSGCGKKEVNLNNKTLEEVEEYVSKEKLELKIDYSYSENIDKNRVISYEKIENVLTVNISKGINKEELYKEYDVNELGRIPVMMYHGIHNKTNSETNYIGGNVDKDGYQRTKEAFIADLEKYYQEDYRMIRLIDYVNGNIDVELGKSPIVLTFDDGLENNILVTGLDDNGNIIIDPNSAVGILESFKNKYPDFKVTATFFVNGGIFRQKDYNEKILNWLVNNGYDVGNHSYTHADFKSTTALKTEEEIGRVYDLLEKYIPGKYVNIVALPFGSPGKKTHPNFQHILNSAYENKSYETISTLQVGWESDYSPFYKNFDRNFIKRIRAYDNNGKDFDIEYNFDKLKSSRYISDGDKNKIVIPKGAEDSLGEVKLEVVTY